MEKYHEAIILTINKRNWKDLKNKIKINIIYKLRNMKNKAKKQIFNKNKFIKQK